MGKRGFATLLMVVALSLALPLIAYADMIDEPGLWESSSTRPPLLLIIILWVLIVGTIVLVRALINRKR